MRVSIKAWSFVHKNTTQKLSLTTPEDEGGGKIHTSRWWIVSCGRDMVPLVLQLVECNRTHGAEVHRLMCVSRHPHMILEVCDVPTYQLALVAPHRIRAHRGLDERYHLRLGKHSVCQSLSRTVSGTHLSTHFKLLQAVRMSVMRILRI